MVAIIHSSSSLRRALNYNEQKVKETKAVCLAAVNYPKDKDCLNFQQKLSRLHNLATLNKRTTVNSVHISLNFDPSEKLSEQKLESIATVYMEKIGFSHQPFLVYQHLDAGHPHVHIVSTNIRADGKRISLHNLGRNQSEKARQEIEVDFGLLRATGRSFNEAFSQKAFHVQKILYGKTDIKRAISNVLSQVLQQYKYTTLTGLNAILHLYNVHADRGGEDSRVYINRGLLYHVLDNKGNNAGIPVKASLIYNNPGLRYLEERFAENEPFMAPLKKRVKIAIDWALVNNKGCGLTALTEMLLKEQISMVVRENKDGLVYGVTFVDHRQKVVFNGSDLGKIYTANAIVERCTLQPAIHNTKIEGSPRVRELSKTAALQNAKSQLENNDRRELASPAGTRLAVIDPLPINDYIPPALKRRKKSRKKKRRLL